MENLIKNVILLLQLFQGSCSRHCSVSPYTELNWGVVAQSTFEIFIAFLDSLRFVMFALQHYFQTCKCAQRSHWSHVSQVNMKKKNKCRQQAGDRPQSAAAVGSPALCKQGEQMFANWEGPSGKKHHLLPRFQEGVTFSWMALPACTILLWISSHPFLFILWEPWTEMEISALSKNVESQIGLAWKGPERSSSSTPLTWAGPHPLDQNMWAKFIPVILSVITARSQKPCKLLI